MEEKCENCDSVKLMMDKLTGKCRGKAFVKFTSADSISKALALSGVEFLGKKIRI